MLKKTGGRKSRWAVPLSPGNERLHDDVCFLSVHGALQNKSISEHELFVNPKTFKESNFFILALVCVYISSVAVPFIPSRLTIS